MVMLINNINDEAFEPDKARVGYFFNHNSISSGKKPRLTAQFVLPPTQRYVAIVKV